mmetsp:Transcript_79928/g.138702  ORF Transcript_79928/g.138702 Transcript_79928/m.138702 type:complete len:101 (-) Transcript_79928:12-314(-)
MPTAARWKASPAPKASVEPSGPGDEKPPKQLTGPRWNLCLRLCMASATFRALNPLFSLRAVANKGVFSVSFDTFFETMIQTTKERAKMDVTGKRTMCEWQ